MKRILAKLLQLFDRRDRLLFAGVIGLTLLGALMETLGVGLIPAFVGLLSSQRATREVGILGWAYKAMGFQDYRAFVRWACLALMGIYVIKNLYLGYLSYLQGRFIYQKQRKISRQLLARYLYQPYDFHLQQNSAELQRNINVEIPNLFNEVMRDVMILLTESMIAVCITILLLASEPISSLIAVSVLGGSTAFFYRVSRQQLGQSGQKNQHHMGQMIQWVNQALGGIKEVKILGREGYFSDQYDRNTQIYTKTSETLYVSQKLPRLFIETIAAICLLIVLLVDLLQGRRPRSLLLLLSLFAAAAFRLMVSMNRILAAMNTIRFYSNAIDVVHHDLLHLQTPLLPTTPISTLQSLRHSLELKAVTYQYPQAETPALNAISLCINRGEAIGFVGPSGAGKSTLVDVLLGLLPPTQGDILIDGIPLHHNEATPLAQWQRQIGYIPQRIYLADDTIRRNIAFGLPDSEIDDDRLWQVLHLAQLEPYIRQLPQQLDTWVGENGLRLSGGQRQRIAIARALYPNPEVLVLDEATAALDNQTEQDITQALETLMGQKTLIIIAHRLTTVQTCDCIYFIKAGRIQAVGSYQDLLANNLDFQAMVGRKV